MNPIVIDAKTAKGAASQTLRGIHKIMSELDIPQDDAGIRVERHLCSDNSVRNFYMVWWEGSAPYEWPILATGQGNIWGEEMTGSLSKAYAMPPTFDFQRKGWGVDCQNICTLVFYPDF